MTKITLESTEPIIKKPRKKRGPYKKKTKTVAISAKKPKKTKQENKTIVGDFIVTNLNQHFSNIIDGALRYQFVPFLLCALCVSFRPFYQTA